MPLYDKERPVASVIAAQGDACVAPTKAFPITCPRRGKPRSKLWPALLHAGCILLVTIIMMGSAHADATTTNSPHITEAQVEQAMGEVRVDPNIRAERKQRTLRWKQATESRERKPSAWLQWWLDTFKWVHDLFSWIADSSRLLAWLLIAALTGVLVVLGLRVLRHLRPHSAADTTAQALTHVRDLDIRPESLPDDIGDSAWSLWQQQARRDALALLYRGLLSRLVNAHRVAIKASSTEADCLALCVPLLDSAQLAYTRKVLTAWQHASYGGRFADDAAFQQLCNDFKVMNPEQPAANAAPAGAAA